MTTTMTSRSSDLSLQNCGKCCITAQRRIAVITILYILTIFICIGAVAFSYHLFQPTILDHPDFDEAAIAGIPEVQKGTGYSTLAVRDDYSIQLCGSPLFDGKNVQLNLTNPSKNNVWFRAEILNKEGKVLGSTGVIKQDQYISVIELTEELKDAETTVTVRVVGYVPNTWHSAGNVNLELVLRVT